MTRPDEFRSAVLSRDTSREAEQLQVRAWRSMSTVAVAGLIAGASQAARALAFAGLRDRHPAAPDYALVPFYAVITLGPALARRVYPELERHTEPASSD